MRTLIKGLRQQGFTIIIASHLLDEVEKICTHVAILKTGVVVAEGSVDQVLVNEDVVEVSAADLDHLETILSQYPGVSKITREGQQIHLHFGKGMARPEEVNSYCHEHGVPLSHLGMKKARLETKFFELTGN
jgi:ABC-2 type transport system ATP-binding protein